MNRVHPANCLCKEMYKKKQILSMCVCVWRERSVCVCVCRERSVWPRGTPHTLMDALKDLTVCSSSTTGASHTHTHTHTPTLRHTHTQADHTHTHTENEIKLMPSCCPKHISCYKHQSVQ